MSLVERFYGPMLIGIFCSLILYGVVLLQAYIYYVTYRRSDRRRIRYLVLWLFLAETVHTAFIMLMMYQPLILQFGEEEATTYFPISVAAEPLFMISVSTPIQVFIAWRIWHLQRVYWIPTLICLLAASSTAGAIWSTVQVTDFRLTSKKPETHPPVLLWFVSSAVADILITASLSFSLYARRTGLKAADEVISRIIVFTIQTGLVTSIGAILDLILLITVPEININFIFDVTLVKIYAISLLSTLNARASLNDQLNHRQNLLFEGRPSDTNWPPEVARPHGLSRASIVFNIEMTTHEPMTDIEGQQTMEVSAMGSK